MFNIQWSVIIAIQSRRLFIDNALINFQITSLQETIREAVNSNFSLFKCLNVSEKLKS